MNETEIRAKSKAKLNQISDLMKILNVTAEAKQMVNKGFIENVVVFQDNEKYPQEEPKAETAPAIETPAVEGNV